MPKVTPYIDVPVAPTNGPKTIHPASGARIILARVVNMTPGTKILLHAPATNGGWLLQDGEGIDLSDYDYRGEVAYTCLAAPAGATVTFNVAEEV